MPARAGPRSARPGAFLATLLTCACTTVAPSGGLPGVEDRPSEPAVEYADISGAWSGFLSIDDQALDATLLIDQTASVLSLRLDASEFGLTAEGEGRLDPDGTIVADLTYETQCGGVARLEGLLAADGLALEGNLGAEDCTGRIEGAFSFRR